MKNSYNDNYLFHHYLFPYFHQYLSFSLRTMTSPTGSEGAARARRWRRPNMTSKRILSIVHCHGFLYFFSFFISFLHFYLFVWFFLPFLFSFFLFFPPFIFGRASTGTLPLCSWLWSVTSPLVTPLPWTSRRH